MMVAARTQHTARSAFDEGVRATFSAALPALPGSAWMQGIRAEALERFQQQGLPHRRLEWWKYTDLAPRVQAELVTSKPSPATAREHFLFATGPFHEIALSEGRVVSLPQAALPDDVEIMPLRDALGVPSLWLRPWFQPAKEALANLNLAFVSDGALVRVGRGCKVAAPVCIRSSLATPSGMAHWRSVISLEEDAELTLIELDQVGAERQCLATAHTSYVLAAGSRLTHIRVTTGNTQALVLRSDTVELAEGADYSGLMLTAGPSMVRQDGNISLVGRGARYDLVCAYAAAGTSVADYSLEVRHVAPETTSRITARGIVGGQGTGVVQGRVRVDRDAQHSDSHQLARGLMLTPGAAINHRPELEIYADDVKCGHGATVGALDANQLFYLRARGIPEAEARRMLIGAWFGDISGRAPENLRGELEGWIETNMTRIGEAG